MQLCLLTRQRVWGAKFGAGVIVLYRENVGNIWAINQHITHFLPKSCQYIPHTHNISPFSPTISPLIVNKSAFSLQVPHSKINILSTNQHFVNAFLSKSLNTSKLDDEYQHSLNIYPTQLSDHHLVFGISAPSSM